MCIFKEFVAVDIMPTVSDGVCVCVCVHMHPVLVVPVPDIKFALVLYTVVNRIHRGHGNGNAAMRSKGHNITLYCVPSCVLSLPQSNRDYYIYYPVDPTPELGMFAVRWGHYKAHYYSHGCVAVCGNPCMTFCELVYHPL